METYIDWKRAPDRKGYWRKLAALDRESATGFRKKARICDEVGRWLGLDNEQITGLEEVVLDNAFYDVCSGSDLQPAIAVTAIIAFDLKAKGVMDRYGIASEGYKKIERRVLRLLDPDPIETYDPYRCECGGRYLNEGGEYVCDRCGLVSEELRYV